MKRRIFIKTSTLSTGVIVLAPSIITSCEKDSGEGPESENGFITIDISQGNYQILQQKGGSVYYENLIIANLGDDKFVVLSKICNHNQCTVGFDSDKLNFPCPCHGSLYDSDGSVLNGPTTKALKNYPVSKEGNEITINTNV